MDNNVDIRSDKRRVAELLLEWADGRECLDSIEKLIEAYVLDLKETQTAGDIRATFKNGTNKYAGYDETFKAMPVEDGVAEAVLEVAIVENTEETEVTDWKELASQLAAKLDFSDQEWERAVSGVSHSTYAIDYKNLCYLYDLKRAVVTPGTPSCSIAFLKDK